jgi:hypothetical protein
MDLAMIVPNSYIMNICTKKQYNVTLLLIMRKQKNKTVDVSMGYLTSRSYALSAESGMLS